MVKRVLQICYLNPYENYGGVERYVLDLSEALTSQYGVTVDILCAGKNSKISKTGTGNIKSVRVLFFGKKELFFISKYIYGRRVRKYLNHHQGDYDAIHFHGDNGLIGRRFAEKTVLTLHGIARGTDSTRKRVSSYLPMQIEKNNVREAGIIFSISSPAKEFFEGYIRNKEIRLIKQSINTSKYHIRSEEEKKEARIKLKIEDNAIVGTITGRDPERKGLDLAIRTINAVEEPGAALYAIGFPKIVSETDKVKFIGNVSEDTKRLYLTASDFFIFPSKKEGFPISVLEAAATGLPLIVSRQSGVSELKDLVPFFREIDSYSLVDYGSTLRELIDAIQRPDFNRVKSDISLINQYSVFNAAAEYMRAYEKLKVNNIAGN